MIPQCYMYVVFSNMVSCISVAHYASCFVLFCNLKQRIGKTDVAAVFS